ncbi:MAG: RNA polymerase sigma factor [Mucilaginibacter sp.]
MSSDGELIILLKSGDQRAFTVLYNRYWRLIYAHVYKMIRDEDEAKDIVQEIFSGMWLKADQVPVQENLLPYLYTIARNKVLNVFRHHKYRDDYFNSLVKYASEVSEDTLLYLDERDLMVAIEREIAALPPRMRQVFEMSRKEHLTYKEIGKRLGTSDETVKKQINKSLKIIRFNLREAGGAAILLLLLNK